MLRKDPQRRKARPGPRSRVRGRDGSGGVSRGASSREEGRFVLYVEGPRDREILEGWARRIDASLARCVEHSAVILGGRQPARAVADFRRRGGAEAGLSGLIVLDRDHHPAEDHATRDEALLRQLERGETRMSPREPGLEVFVWGLRHIESYLLVPSAIRRLLRLEDHDQRVERVIAEAISGSLPPSEAPAERTHGGGLHAKRILGAGGSLSEALGAELHAGAIARSMRSGELHADIDALFERIGELAGVVPRRPEVVVRGPRGGL